VIEMMFGYGAHWAFWQVSLMWIAMIAFWGLLIWAVYALITAARGPGQDRGKGDGARQILDGRLARGEIDDAEYQRLRDLLSSPRQQEQSGTGDAR
jgi:putative membrane protein